MNTALGLRSGGLPAVVEAVAAYRSEESWRAEVRPADAAPANLVGAEALVQLARPFLMPELGSRSRVDMLRDAVEVAADPKFALVRAGYHDWFRDFFENARAAQGVALQEMLLDQQSVQVAKDRLASLWEQERELIRQDRRRDNWTRVEWAVATVGMAIGVGVAATAALPALGVAALGLPFAGWAISKINQPRESRTLGGASVFVEAHKRLPWLETPLAI